MYHTCQQSSLRTVNRYTEPMVDLGMYEFKYLFKGKNTPKEYLINEYVEEVLESEYVRTSPDQLHTFLDAKCDKEGLNKVTKTNDII